MCLYVNQRATEEYRQRHAGKKRVVVWKVVAWDEVAQQWVSRFRNKPIRFGWFTARGKLRKERVEAGAIHVHTTRIAALWWRRGRQRVVRCQAMLADFIGTDKWNDDAAFTKIWIPKQNPPRK